MSRSRQQRVRYDDSLSIDAVNNNDRKTKRLLDNSVALLQLFKDEPEKIRQPQSDELLAQTEVAKEQHGDDEEDPSKRRCHVWVKGLDQSFKVRYVLYT